MDSQEWEKLCATWRRDLTDFDDLVIAERTQAARTGFAVLLLLKGEPRAFVKVGRGVRGALEAEDRVVKTVWEQRPQSFSVPEPLGIGVLNGWSYRASAPFQSPNHRVPCDPPIGTIAAEIRTALAALPRTADTPAHWQPMHGDLTPWNLREMPDGSRMLFDWEEAGWGPPGADEVLYYVTSAAIGRPLEGERDIAGEAITFWHDRIGARAVSGRRDRTLDDALLETLARMRDRFESGTSAAAER